MEKIKGHSELYRNTKTGAIINSNKTGADAARHAKKKRSVEAKRLESIEEDLEEVKNLLKKLLER